MYYVYELIDPINNVPFYVGKGHGNRAKTHLWGVSKSRNAYKESKISAIREKGMEPIVKYVVENIECEEVAYKIESELIKKYGRKGYEENGILTNVCVDSRPPNHKGKTYEQIYGIEGAKVQKEKRSQLQKERGGYGPIKHSLETKKLISAKSSGEKNGMYGKHHSEETKEKIRSNKSNPSGKTHVLSKCYKLVSPENKTYELYGGELHKFCKENNLSLDTFRKSLAEGWPPSKKGKNKGWKIY